MLPFSLLIWYLDLINIFALPVVYAFFISSLPQAIPPVGKSGPLTICKISSTVHFGLSILKIVASIISPKLWGGISVA